MTRQYIPIEISALSRMGAEVGIFHSNSVGVPRIIERQHKGAVVVPVGCRLFFLYS